LTEYIGPDDFAKLKIDAGNIAKFVNEVGPIVPRYGSSYPSLKDLVTTIQGAGGFAELELVDGSAATPSVRFQSNPDSGIYYIGGEIAVASNGVKKLSVGDDGLKLPDIPLAPSEGGTGVRSISELGALLSVEAGTSYNHVQSSAASVWTINHNLGRPVSTVVFSPGGAQVLAGVLNTSVNQTTVTFTNPETGSALVG
jgi:hypothetical protein